MALCAISICEWPLLPHTWSLLDPVTVAAQKQNQSGAGIATLVFLPEDSRYFL